MTKTTITRESLESMTLAGLTDVYNQYAPKPIKKFTCSRTAAVERVVKVLPVEQKTAKKTAAQGLKGPGPRTGVCRLMAQLFSEGLSPKDVFAKIQEQLPEARTSLRAVYWYRSYLRSQSAA